MIYPIKIQNDDDLKKICSLIKTDPRALAFLQPKANILHLFADKIDYRAAAFLKQELLARGGDTVVTKHVIDGKTDSSDVLLMATPSQLRSLLEKLKAMDCWGLKEFRDELSKILMSLKKNSWLIKSPAGHEIKLSHDTKLMAIINLTPDSFYGPSRTTEKEILITAEKFLSEGAEILDLGAESTRPGFTPLPESLELERLLPALKTLRAAFPEVFISVDTYKPEVARIAANEGADLINDISGFEFEEFQNMPEVIAGLKIPYVLSNFRGQENESKNILSEINFYFADKLKILEEAGVKRENIILDVGFGFGKGAAENLELVKNIESFKIFGLPLLAGHSRKRFTGKSLGGTLAVTTLLCGRVSLLRVHDVEENLNALKISKAL